MPTAQELTQKFFGTVLQEHKTSTGIMAATAIAAGCALPLVAPAKLSLAAGATGAVALRTYLTCKGVRKEHAENIVLAVGAGLLAASGVTFAASTACPALLPVASGLLFAGLGAKSTAATKLARALCCQTADNRMAATDYSGFTLVAEEVEKIDFEQALKDLDALGLAPESEEFLAAMDKIMSGRVKEMLDAAKMADVKNNGVSVVYDAKTLKALGYTSDDIALFQQHTAIPENQPKATYRPRQEQTHGRAFGTSEKAPEKVAEMPKRNEKTTTHLDEYYQRAQEISCGAICY